jgi:prevent-host-death family protein
MNLKVSEDVIPVTDLRTHSARVLTQVAKTGRPVVITRRGRSTAVLEDVEQYERRVERLRLCEKLIEGMQAVQRGDVIPSEEVMREVDAVIVAHEKTSGSLVSARQKRPAGSRRVHRRR